MSKQSYLADGIFARSNSVKEDFKQMLIDVGAVIDKLFVVELNRLLVNTLLKEAIFLQVLCFLF